MGREVTSESERESVVIWRLPHGNGGAAARHSGVRL